MPLGLSTLFLVTQKKGFESVASLLSEPIADRAGYFEIVDNGSLRLTDASTKMLTEFAQAGFRFTVHSPYENINVASSDPAKRRLSIDAVKGSLERSSKFDALNVAVHPGAADTGTEPEAAFETNCDSLMELWDYSRSLGQHMAVENDIAHGKGILVRPDDFKRFFSLAGSKLPILLDVGHANISNSLKEFVRDMSSDFAELHLHDNDGGWDQHLAIGKGTADFGALKSLFLNTSLLFTVESVHDPYESFDRLSNLRREALMI
ncbi:MAG: sugar phosphate isomerase/epimerase family protein [Conexivisphaerales archaeon]